MVGINKERRCLWNTTENGGQSEKADSRRGYNKRSGVSSSSGEKVKMKVCVVWRGKINMKTLPRLQVRCEEEAHLPPSGATQSGLKRPSLVMDDPDWLCWGNEVAGDH